MTLPIACSIVAAFFAGVSIGITLTMRIYGRRCWPPLHKWTKWQTMESAEWSTYIHQAKACVRCGKVRRRAV